jgi:hypothetical protein
MVMAKRLKKGEPTVPFSFVMPRSLHTRLLKRAAKETTDTETRVSPAEICRVAIEEYLDLYEGATFVKEGQAAPASQGTVAAPEATDAKG